MKKLIYLLLAPVLAFTGCADDTDAPDMQLAPPRVVATDTVVEVKCTTTIDDAVLATLEKGFAYGTAAQAEEEYLHVTDPQVEGHVMSCRIEGLAQRTDYRIYAYVDVGTMRMKSPVATFTTGGQNEKPDPEVEPAFGRPSVTSVTSSAATLGCTLEYTGDKELAAVWFAYKTGSDDERRADVSAEPGAKSAQVAGLAASTAYSFRLCAEVGGEFYASAWGEFTTAPQNGGSSGTKHSGWAELPGEVERPGDYHYLYKMADGKRNYTVCYSAEYHCAVWTAHPMHSWYTNGDAGRASFTYDPDLDRDLQPHLDGTYSPSTYHRGHMVASSDRQRSKTMNKQVFYYTNMAPQIQNEFNGGIWNKLERKIQGDYMCSDTLYVVTGSYFGDPSKTCWDSDGQSGGCKVTVPTHFYKVLLRTKSGNTRKPVWELPADQLKCCVFWFEHSTKYGTKGSPTREHMMTVSEAEKKTGLTFFANVPNAPKSTMNPSEWGM